MSEATCPGLLALLAGLRHRSESPFIRAVVYQWFETHRDAGTLENAIREVIQGPGFVSVPGGPNAAPITAASLEASTQPIGNQEFSRIFSEEPDLVPKQKIEDFCQPAAGQPDGAHFSVDSGSPFAGDSTLSDDSKRLLSTDPFIEL